MGIIKHGHCNGGISPTYHSWASMVARCTNTNKREYARYGGRGITVCGEWSTFVGFLKDMGEKPIGMTLDRVDNNKGYYKENCRWASPSEQSKNKRNNIWVTYKGKTMCVSDWARATGIPRLAISRRLKMGWPTEKALELKPVIGRNQYNPPNKHIAEAVH